MTTQRKQFVTTVTATGASRSADEPEMMVSTRSVDREGDRVPEDGMDLTAFRRNPAMWWNHEVRGNSLPIATVTGLTVEPGRGLRARWRWLANDPMAERIRNAWDQGVVRAASIGFLSRRRQPNEHGGVDHLETELLEISLVGLPANAEAVRQLKRLGLEPLGSAPSSTAEIDVTPAEVCAALAEVAGERVARVLARRDPRGHEEALRERDGRFILDDDDPDEVSEADVLHVLRVLAAEAADRALCRLTGRVD